MKLPLLVEFRNSFLGRTSLQKYSFQLPYMMPHTKPIVAVNIISTGPSPIEISGMYSCISPPKAPTSPPSMHPTTANQSPYPTMFLSVVTICRLTLGLTLVKRNSGLEVGEKFPGQDS